MLEHLKLALLARDQFEGDPEGALTEMEYRVRLALSSHRNIGNEVIAGLEEIRDGAPLRTTTCDQSANAAQDDIIEACARVVETHGLGPIEPQKYSSIEDRSLIKITEVGCRSILAEAVRALKGRKNLRDATLEDLEKANALPSSTAPLGEPKAWMVERESCDPPEVFLTEVVAKQNAARGLADTVIVPLYSERQLRAALPSATAPKKERFHPKCNCSRQTRYCDGGEGCPRLPDDGGPNG